MVRLHVVVEGQTEETFVRDLLAPSLGLIADVHRVTTGRKGPTTYRGGHTSYQHLRRDLTRWMAEDRHSESWFTTMVDLYRIPNDVPGYEKSRKIRDPVERVKFLEREFKSDIGHPRFAPYIQLHEFEALLFSDPESFLTSFPDNRQAVAALARILEQLSSPEYIDDGAFPQFMKPVDGPKIAREIGLPKLRAACPHFNEWIDALLSL